MAYSNRSSLCGATLALVVCCAFLLTQQDDAKAANLPPSIGNHEVVSTRILQLREDREQALQLKLDGKVNRGDKVVRLGNGRYVETALERTERVFVVLVEYPDQRHNQFPQPDRSVDPFTPWEADYNRAYYEDLVFTQMRRYFETQSTGRYSISGYVTDWITLPSSMRANDHRSRAAAGIAAWVDGQVAAGKTLQDVKDFLATFDKSDPFDANHNGVFDEPDGSLDRVIFMEAGVPANDDCLAFGGGADEDHAGFISSPFAIGATALSVASTVYCGEGTALGVMVHEYTHLLGLPDEYIFVAPGSTVGQWSLMSDIFILGDRPGLTGALSLSAWDKLQLGWLNYEVTTPGARGAYTLGAAAASANTKAPQALIVNLTPDTNPISLATSPIDPPERYAFWFANPAIGSAATMTRTVSVPPARPVLTMKLWWDSPGPGLNYAYVEMSVNGGATWTRLASPGITTNNNPHGFNEGNGITGTSGAAATTWGATPSVVTASFDLDAHAGKDVLLRMRLQKNAPNASWIKEMLSQLCGGCALNVFLPSQGVATLDEYFASWEDYVGLVVDDIALGKWSDGAESADSGWTLAGFVVRSSKRPHYYVAEYRNHDGSDAAFIDGLVDRSIAPPVQQLARFGYDPGLLVWYRNRAVLVHHSGRGLYVIDAHPGADRYGNGQPLLNSLQVRDAAFSLAPTAPLRIHDPSNGNAPLTFPSLPPQPVFDDSRDYTSPVPRIGVAVPGTGTRIEVVNTEMQGAFMHIITGPRGN